MKIMSVIPAAAASSTAYWISGLSTIGSISFGLALVAGRKRVPSPATGNTALVIFCIVDSSFCPRLRLGCGRKEAHEARLVENGDRELVRLRELAAGVCAGDNVVRLLRDAARGLAAGGLDQRLRIVARERRQGAGQDDRKARELA